LKDGSGAGFYREEPEVVERLSTPAYTSGWFQRTLTPLNANLIRAHLRAAVDTALDVTLTKERARVSNEAARNLTAGCKWCDYAHLCRAQMWGGPDGEYDLTLAGLRPRQQRGR
jgi:hypothetical protein